MIPAAHVHLLLNHVPVIGSLFALGLLAWGLWRRSEELQRAALGAVVVVALMTIPTYLSGEPAWEDIMGLPAAQQDPQIEAHQRAAQFAFGASLLTGIVAMITLVKGCKGKPLATRWVAAILVLSLATTGVMAYVANLGGMIRHLEIREGGIPEDHSACTLKNAALSGVVKRNSSLPLALMTVCGTAIGKGTKLLRLAGEADFSTPMVRVN